MFRSVTLLFLSLLLPLAASGPLLQHKARVAVIGDSITEQKRYSRFIEMYLTVCQPQLEAQVFQYGWGGERAEGFLKRMDRDLKFFKPTFATLCYGMNDGQYKAFEPQIGESYKKPLTEIVRKLKAEGVTVVMGGPGAVDIDFYKRASPEIYNQNLQKLSEIAKNISGDSALPFANLHALMMEVMLKAKPPLGSNYDVCGPDGFHPNPNGHLIMAYAFLKTMGFDGDLGAITLDLKGEASAQGGHKIKSFNKGTAEIESSRYPFCFFGDGKSSQSTISILPYLPFNADLNRLTLKVKNADSPKLKVTWGSESKTFSKEEIEKGINLAAEFIPNPFNEAYAKVDAAVAQKEDYETDLVKLFTRTFDSLQSDFKNEAETVAATQLLEKKCQEKWNRLSQSAHESFKPVHHTIRIEPAL